MEISAYRTPKVIVGDDLFTLLDRHLPKIHEKSIVVVTSKIISICEGNVIKNDGTVDKNALIHKESDFFIDDELTRRYGITLTVKNDTLIASAGIDESNGNGYFILWPKNVMKTAGNIWDYLRKRDGLDQLGVIITDSRTIPMRWGTLGVGIGWCGFDALHDYIGSRDIFGRKLKVTKSSVLDGLAAAAVLVMGEGNEQTPLAVISDGPMVRFTDHKPTKEETAALHISLSEDIYAPLTDSPRWQKGGGGARFAH